jgi:dihydrofolate reductase
MGRIVVSENVSLDGVVQDPTGEEGFARGGWFRQLTDEDRAAWSALALDEALGAAALLLGRRSEAWFAARWPARSGALADRLNGLPKYVVASPGHTPQWSHGTVLAGDVVAEVARLRQEVAGDVVCYASAQLVRTLLEHDLVDELRLIVYPIVLGAGDRLFGETSDAKSLRLVDVRTVGTGLALLTYRP